MPMIERFSEDYYRVINQHGVRQARPVAAGNDNYNACWDGALSPQGDLFFTFSSEKGAADHAKLVRYDYDRNEIVDCLYVGDLIIPKDRQLPHSKLHTSINFLNDGRVIATTHSTDKPKHHPEWMLMGHHSDLWEGFSGSAIVVYDPATGKSEFWGVPVVHESIYGAKYDPAHNRLYMIGFTRGHIYCFDIATRKVEDLGKAAELFNYRLVLGADGNIYSCTKSGYLYRINTETNRLEDLGFAVPDEPGHHIHNTWYKYMVNGRSDPSGRFLYWRTLCSDYLMKLDYESLAVSRAGRMIPAGGVVDKTDPTSDHDIDTFIVDREGVLWYHLHMFTPRTRLSRYYEEPNYLMRWDIAAGGEPELLGLIGTPEHVQALTTEMEYDPERDILYCIDLGQGFGADGPGVVAIDLGEFRQHMHEPGPISTDTWLRPRDLTAQELTAQHQAGGSLLLVGEESPIDNPFWAFPVDKAYPVRIWRHTPREDKEDSKVIGMAFDEKDDLHVVTGAQGEFDRAKFVIRIEGRDVVERLDFSSMEPTYRAWLSQNLLPRPVDRSTWDAVRLPEATGRRYRAVATAVAAWNNGRVVVGTRDGLLAIVDDDGGVFGLGNAAANGPVRCMCVNSARTKLWGVAGDDEDLGYVFSYDDTTGLRQLGILNYNVDGHYGTTASNVLSSVTLNHAETILAIGGADRTATVHLIELS